MRSASRSANERDVLQYCIPLNQVEMNCARWSDVNKHVSITVIYARSKFEFKIAKLESIVHSIKLAIMHVFNV